MGHSDENANSFHPLRPSVSMFGKTGKQSSVSIIWFLNVTHVRNDTFNDSNVFVCQYDVTLQ